MIGLQKQLVLSLIGVLSMSLSVRAINDDDGDGDCNVVAIPEFPFAGAILSVISYSFIFYLYYVKKLPTLKRHPTCKLLKA